MNFINKLERKYGRYAIHDLIKYIIILYVLGALLYLINPNFYDAYLSLNVGMILKGQVWRLVTFIIYPASIAGGFGIFFFAVEMYLYLMIGRSLENAWGPFRFNLYYISGLIFNIIAAFILYFIFGGTYPMGLTYINQSMFFAFATLYPNVQFLLFFIIPVKVKYLGYLYGAIVGYEIFSCIRSAFTVPIMFRHYFLAKGIAIFIALLNFVIFFFATRNYKRISPASVKRRRNYHRQVNKSKTITRHKCAVCGRTEQDDENLEFRFCSKCDGNYEYCMEHLFTHTHVKK